MSKGRKRQDAQRPPTGVPVTVLTVSVIGGQSSDVISALRRSGEMAELELLGTADITWNIEDEH